MSPDQYYRIQSAIVEKQTIFNKIFLDKLENSKNTVEINKNFFGLKDKAVYAILVKKLSKIHFDIHKWCIENKIYYDIDDTIQNSFGGNFEIIIRFDMIVENKIVIEI